MLQSSNPQSLQPSSLECSNAPVADAATPPAAQPPTPFVPTEIDRKKVLQSLQPKRPEKLNVRAVVKSLEVVTNDKKAGSKPTGFIRPGAVVTGTRFEVAYQNGRQGDELKLSRQQAPKRFLSAWVAAPAAVAAGWHAVAAFGVSALPVLAGAGLFAGIAGAVFKAQRQETFKSAVTSQLERLKGNKDAPAEKMMVDLLAAYSMVQKLPWGAHTYDTRVGAIGVNGTSITILQPLLSAMQVVAQNWDTLRAQPTKSVSPAAASKRAECDALVDFVLDKVQELEGAFNRGLNKATMLHTVCGVTGAAALLIQTVGTRALGYFFP